MKTDLNKTKEERIKDLIKESRAAGVSDLELDKQLRKQFGVHLKMAPSRSKYTPHVGAKQMDKLLKSGKVVRQANTTAEVSVSYTPPTNEN